MKKEVILAYIVLLTIFSLKFFEATFLNSTIMNYAVFLLGLSTLAIGAFYLLSKKGGFVFPMQLILCSIVCSIPMAYLAWSQGIKDTLIETAPFFMWGVFFLLINKPISIGTVEKIIIWVGISYIILYFFQLSQSPTVLFGKSLWGDEFTVDRGIIRIIFPGGGFFVLFSFMAINKLTNGAPKRPLWFFVALLGLVIPVLQVTRQFIFFISLLYLFHFIRRQDMIKKTLILGAFATIVIIILNSNFVIVNEMLSAIQRDISLGKDYIRVTAGAYFLTDFSPHFFTQIFGNGAPYWGLSAYGKYIEYLGERYHFFLADVGFVTWYIMFGLGAVLGYFIIWYKSIVIPLPKEFQYLKYYLWFVGFTSMTWFSVYSPHFMMSTILVIYMYHRIWTNTFEIQNAEGRVFKYYMMDK